MKCEKCGSEAWPLNYLVCPACNGTGQTKDTDMTEIEKKALALVNEVRRDRGSCEWSTMSRHRYTEHEALCRAIEQHEAFRREVSDAIDGCILTPETEERLSRFMLPEPVKTPEERLREVLPSTFEAWDRSAIAEAVARWNDRAGLELKVKETGGE